MAYLRRVLRCGPSDSVFLYVNSTFAPALDEIVGNLHRVRPPVDQHGSWLNIICQCFRNQGDDQLVVAYSMTPAFG